MEFERAVANLVEKLERRFYGKYRGFVEDTADPEHIGRLRLRVPSVLGSELITGWALPCVPYGGAANQGELFIPEQGAGVWVEFEEGDLEFPVWVGTFWSKPDGESESPKPNGPDGAEQDGVQGPPTRKIIKTGKGHTIQLEDKDGEEAITVVQWVDKDNGKKNVITLDADGIRLTDLTGNVIEMKTDALTVTSKVPFKIDASGQSVEIVAESIDFSQG